MTIGHIEYIDGRFLAGGCASRQRQVADGADVVFTDPLMIVIVMHQ